jgi:chemotaxis protein MotB
MSFRRKTYDGNFFGGSDGSAERRDTFDFAGKTDKHASSKRTARNGRYLNEDADLFHEEADKDRYLITYADLITLLLGLFIILYAISNVDLNKYTKMISAMENVFGNKDDVVKINSLSPGDVKVITSKIDNLKTQLSDLIVKHNYTKSVTLEENERGITIHILENILFPSGKAELNITSKLVLNELAGILRQLPNDIRVEGHTDNIPISSVLYPSNWHLSVARALNTAYYFINDQKLKPEKVTVVGYAEYKPIADNSTAEGRAKNRRVDIVIIK